MPEFRAQKLTHSTAEESIPSAAHSAAEGRESVAAHSAAEGRVAELASAHMPLEARGLAYAYAHRHREGRGHKGLQQDAHHGAHKHYVFADLSLVAQPGLMLAILGNNGAGKSTLLDLLAGITTPAAGQVLIDGRDAQQLSRREIARSVAYVAQQQRVPHLSVYDEVLLGRKPHISWALTQEDRAIVSRALVDLELEPFTDRYCDELSGGERQKVFIARALAQQPRILLLDEPTSALDPKNQLEVLEVVRRLTREAGLATIMVLHDVNLALRFCDQFLLMRGRASAGESGAGHHAGHVVAFGDRSVVTDEALSLTYDTPFKIVEIDGTPVALPAKTSLSSTNLEFYASK